MQNIGGRQSPLATCVLTHLVVHLLRAVEYIDHDAKGSTQVFGSLSLPCACRAGRRSTHGQVQGLGQGDVASKYSGDTHTCNTDEECNGTSRNEKMLSNDLCAFPSFYLLAVLPNN